MKHHWLEEQLNEQRRRELLEQAEKAREMQETQPPKPARRTFFQRLAR
ncbi:MAG: hypothetical protein MUE40_02745 [Anaerolineae bacterium]|jgi:hypothetical protein|nr:hypothetical protein [Anaerolineae bacterium]